LHQAANLSLHVCGGLSCLEADQGRAHRHCRSAVGLNRGNGVEVGGELNLNCSSHRNHVSNREADHHLNVFLSDIQLILGSKDGESEVGNAASEL
jgi:hypothetical protein